MTSRKLNHLPPWPQLSFVLAKDISAKGMHTKFLTPSETQYFEDAIDTFSKWLAFTTTLRTDAPTPADNTIAEPEIAAFRVRSMLFEQFIPHLFHSDRPCCRESRIDLDQLCQLAYALPLPDPSELDSLPPPRAHQQQSYTKPSSSQSTPAAEDNETGSTGIEPDTSATVGLLSAEQMAQVPLWDIYHTLEYDHKAMIEQQKLEEFEAQAELNEEEKDNLNDHSLSMFNTNGNFNLKYLLQGIAANRLRTSLTDRELQNLLSDFKPHRSKWANDDKIGQEELYDACEKVLNDLKNYTEHSTPFLNKVTKREAPDYFDVIKRPMDLGTVTKKMKQFQYKSKKEFGDDLYLIYENCLVYNSEPTNPFRKHAIAMRRKTDRLMARVPDITVKDRSEVEVDEEGDDASDDDETDVPRLNRKAPGTHKHPVKSERIGSPMVNMDQHLSQSFRERSLTRGSSAAPPSTTDIVGHQIGAYDNENARFTPDSDISRTLYSGKHVKSLDNNGQPVNIDLEQEEKDISAEIDADLGEFQDQVWRDMTKKTRAKMGTTLEKQIQFPFSERQAIVRTSLDMERFAMLEHTHDDAEASQKLVRCTNEKFLQWTERRGLNASLYDEFDLESSDDENLDAFFSRRMAKPKAEEDDASRTDLFLPEYLVRSGIPEIAGVPEDLVDDDELARRRYISRRASLDSIEQEPTNRLRGYTEVSVDVYPSVAFPNHGLHEIVEQNLQELRAIRHVYAKCNAVRNNVPISTLTSSILAENPESQINGISPSPLAADTVGSSITSSTSITVKPKIIPPLIINPTSGQQLLQRTLTKLLAHAGFEGAQTGALNVLTELFMDYMLNIGKTLRCYWDDYGQQMSSEEIIIHTLYDNGVMDLSELESYVVDDVDRYGHRLEDLHRKLELSYQDILSGPVEKTVQDENALFEDEENFTTGTFGEDIGEDFFGFKELGLDKECNLTTFSIPSRLWFGKSKQKEEDIKTENKEPLFKYPPPPAFTPISSERDVIGLLRPLFRKKLSEATQGLFEDEYLPNRYRNRPRYPPTNKNSAVGRRRAGRDGNTSGGSGGAGGEKKSKRKRPLEEIKAEKEERDLKRRQKIEERAQKQAEKDRKKELREKQKQQERQAKIEAKEKKALAKKTKQPATQSSIGAPARRQDDDN
ncbi:Transcriptional activator spt7 [Apophysomyces sp. BC1034]|nr:Transcriptional activator spt7 [Apophysomyces sp. BC1015]KAG0181251.1 Transcriptional activator spt7 [Apophysomyces sp. BC1021]KAG0191667.1 Transcriptional activator spt7 [Apophysomyces sp. BC1034]